MISPTRDQVVLIIKLQCGNKIIQEIVRHTTVIHKAYRLSLFSVSDAAVYFFKEGFRKVIIDIQFSIPDKFGLHHPGE